jgi:hypothetical protein
MNNTAQNGGGMYCSDAHSVLYNCEIVGNKAWHYDGGGLFLTYSCSLEMVNCRICGNGWGGVFQDKDSHAMYRNCTICSNASRGVVLEDESRATFTNCTIAGHSWGGVTNYYHSRVTVTNSILWNAWRDNYELHGTVTYTCIRGGLSGAGNISTYPLFSDPAHGDYRLQNHSTCIDRGIDVGLPYNGAAPDLGAWETPPEYSAGSNPQPRIWYVNGSAPAGGDGNSWSTAFQAVGGGLFVSSASDEVRVAEGSYNEAIFMPDKVGLYGGFAGTESTREERNWAIHPTILDAAGLDHAVIEGANVEKVTIDGFTITGGHARSSSGGGLSFSSVRSATVANCTISGNKSDRDGGGIESSGSNLTLSHCKISDNTSGLDGGGATLAFGSQKLEDCIITTNGAKSGGGLSFTSSSATLMNSTIIKNTAESGGGITSYGSSPTLRNCSISGNEAVNGPALRSDYYQQRYSTKADIINCIIWNGDDWFWNNDGSTISLAYSDVQQATVYAGEGNINFDPLFRDPGGGDFRLQAGSPCIDSGTTVALNQDLDGTARPIEIPGVGRDGLCGVFDMGAYEYFLGGNPTCSPTPSPSPTQTPTPFTPSDLNVGNIVNAADLLRILQSWHAEVQNASPEDLNHDHALDLMDLSIFQKHWEESTGP